MNAKEYLRQIRLLDVLIQDKKNEIQRWDDSANSLGGFSVGERVQSSRNLHKMQDAIHESIDLKNEVVTLSNKRQEIISTIKRLPADECKVLYMVYVNGLLVKQAAVECKKSYIWAKKMHTRGLNGIQSMLDSQ